MANRSRNRIIVISIVTTLGFVLYFKPFSRTQIIILNHLTEVNDDGVVSQICLVKNPPNLSSVLKFKIEQFDNQNPVEGKYYKRLFIKEHKKMWFADWFLYENTDYQSKNTTRDDLDNIDFLADSDFWPTNNGQEYKRTHIMTGKYWYYKY